MLLPTIVEVSLAPLEKERLRGQCKRSAADVVHVPFYRIDCMKSTGLISVSRSENKVGMRGECEEFSHAVNVAVQSPFTTVDGFVFGIMTYVIEI